MIARTGRVLVAGGGPAAASAATALRDLGHEGPITLLSAERGRPYSRPPLSKAFLTGDAGRDEILLPLEDVDVRLGVRVDRIDPDAHLVLTADGEALQYDGLVVATGTIARRPADDSVAVLATVEDAQSLRPRLAAAQTAVVVGSGLLAYELASAAVSFGVTTTLVIRRAALSARVGALGAFLLDRARAHGVTILETDHGGVFRDGGVQVVEHGRREADLVLAALGTTVDTTILPEYASPGRGILVDSWCRVAPDVVAAGDIALTRGAGGAAHRDATWTNALGQGRAAAQALLDETAPPYRAISYGWTEGFGVEVKFAGTIPADTPLELVDGDLATAHALLRWPGAAAAVGYRIPIGHLRNLAATARNSAIRGDPVLR